MKTLSTEPKVVLYAKILQYKDRDVVVVKINGRAQPFYRSTGRNSGMPQEWLPFDGIKNAEYKFGQWFDKHRYTIDPKEPWNKYGFGIFHRYGSKELYDISQLLKQQNLPKGKVVKRATTINNFLGVSYDQYGRRLKSCPN